jgi:predicted aspartyl protease
MNIRQKALGTLFLCLIGLHGILSCSSQDQQESFGAQPASQVHFEIGSSACNIPFRIVDNTMHVTIRINDSIDVLAAFDSGFPLNGVLVIDSAVASKLGLVYIGSVGLGGAGDETAVADIAVGATVSLPGVTFKGQQVLVARDTRNYEKWLPSAIIGNDELLRGADRCEKSRLHVYKNGSFIPSAGEI